MRSRSCLLNFVNLILPSWHDEVFMHELVEYEVMFISGAGLYRANSKSNSMEEIGTTIGNTIGGALDVPIRIFFGILGATFGFLPAVGYIFEQLGNLRIFTTSLSTLGGAIGRLFDSIQNQ